MLASRLCVSLTLQIRSGQGLMDRKHIDRSRLLHLDVIRLTDCQRGLRWLLLVSREFLALSQPLDV